eukprot:2854671-Prymnesium_polylepis.1
MDGLQVGRRARRHRALRLRRRASGRARRALCRGELGEGRWRARGGGLGRLLQGVQGGGARGGGVMRGGVAAWQRGGAAVRRCG